MKAFFKTTRLKVEPLRQLKLSANNRIKEKYNCDLLSYGSLIINYIIYNEKAHIVSLFKDYLIFDDHSEFLKRYYTTEESNKRLKKFYEYYDLYSLIYPNYTCILEGKYLYRNIQKKQKMINIQEEIEHNAKNTKRKNYFSDEVFSTDVYDSIINDRNNEDLDSIFNVNDNSIDMDNKLKDLITEINKNDNTTRNLNHSGHNIQLQPTLISSISTKKKIMISTLLGRNQTMNNSSLFVNDNNSQNSRQQKNRSNFINNSINSPIPFTDRPSSTNKTTNKLRQSQSRQFSKAKLIAEYSNTIFNSNISNLKNKVKRGDSGIPFTYRQHIKKESNELNFTKQNKKEREREKSEKSQIKTPPKYTKNFIYIINQNPKYTTNVAYYNNNQTSKRPVSKKSNSKKSPHDKTSSNNQTQIPSNKQTLTVNKTKTCHLQVNEEQKPKTRNNGNQLQNNYMLKTSRDSTYKERLNLLRTSSQLSIPYKHKDNYYSTKYLTKRNSIRGTSTSRNKSLSNQQTNKGDGLTQRNDCISKRISANISNSGTYAQKQQDIKSIQIKNFSKVFSLNISQINSDRKKN